MVQRPTPDGESRPSAPRENLNARPAPVLTDRQKKKRAAEAKGKRLELQVKAWLESRGWLVETAPKVTVWIWNPGLGAKMPISTRHDFFGVWDGIAVNSVQYDRRAFYQVTTVNHIAHKRTKIHDSGFPATTEDAIYAYAGRPRRWRVLVGPDFLMPGESFTMGEGRHEIGDAHPRRSSARAGGRDRDAADPHDGHRRSGGRASRDRAAGNQDNDGGFRGGGPPIAIQAAVREAHDGYVATNGGPDPRAPAALSGVARRGNQCDSARDHDGAPAQP